MTNTHTDPVRNLTPEQNGELFRARTETAGTFAEELVDALLAQNIGAEIAGTGGGCMAIIIPLSATTEILVTDGDAALPDGGPLYVGLYVWDDDPKICYWSEDGATHTVVEALEHIVPVVGSFS